MSTFLPLHPDQLQRNPLQQLLVLLRRRAFPHRQRPALQQPLPLLPHCLLLLQQLILQLHLIDLLVLQDFPKNQAPQMLLASETTHILLMLQEQ